MDFVWFYTIKIDVNLKKNQKSNREKSKLNMIKFYTEVKLSFAHFATEQEHSMTKEQTEIETKAVRSIFIENCREQLVLS